jgi:hypothetical protein
MSTNEALNLHLGGADRDYKFRSNSAYAPPMLNELPNNDDGSEKIYIFFRLQAHACDEVVNTANGCQTCFLEKTK